MKKLLFAIALVLPVSAWCQKIPEPYNDAKVIVNFPSKSNPHWDWQLAAYGEGYNDGDHFMLIGTVEDAYVGYDDYIVYVSAFTTVPIEGKGMSDGPTLMRLDTETDITQFTPGKSFLFLGAYKGFGDRKKQVEFISKGNLIPMIQIDYLNEIH